MADVQQIKKIVPLIACVILICHYVCELVFGVDILDLNFGVQIISVKQPIKGNSVGGSTLCFSFDQFKFTLEENTPILHCKTTCCYRGTSPSTSITLEAPTICTRSLILN